MVCSKSVTADGRLGVHISFGKLSYSFTLTACAKVSEEQIVELLNTKVALDGS